MNFIDVISRFQTDEQTQGIIMVGEIGGSEEEEAAEYIKNHVTKPVGSPPIPTQVLCPRPRLVVWWTAS
jgi:hypothetical protein